MPIRPPLHRPEGWRPPKRQSRRRTDEADRFYDTHRWRLLSDACKARDGYQCTSDACRTVNRGHGGRLVAAHIIPRRQGGPDALSNLRTLCPSCDNKIEPRRSVGQQVRP